MRRPPEKLYRIKVVLTWFERGDPSHQAIPDLYERAMQAISAKDQRHITGVEVKRRFRV
jgi:hypothetical protein